MIDVLNVGTKPPSTGLASRSSHGSSAGASAGSLKPAESSNPKDEHKPGYAEAAERVEEAEADGKTLPDTDKGLPIGDLDGLLVDSVDEQLVGDMEELDVIQGESIDGLPAIPLEGRSAATASMDIPQDAADSVRRAEGGTIQKLSRVEGDPNANKPELSLSQSVSKELSTTETREASSFEKRPMSADLKTVTQNKTEVSVPVKVGENGWQEGVSQRVMMLISQRNSMARIHVNPPELGPVEVRLNVNHEQASVQFLSHSAQVRDALEQSIPRLRDMLETAGLELADSHVGEQNQSEGESPGGDSGSGANESANETLDEQGARVASAAEGLLDAYA